MVYVYILLLYVIELFSSESDIPFSLLLLGSTSCPCQELFLFPREMILVMYKISLLEVRFWLSIQEQLHFIRQLLLMAIARWQFYLISLLEQKLLFISFEFQYSIDSYTSFENACDFCMNLTTSCNFAYCGLLSIVPKYFQRKTDE